MKRQRIKTIILSVVLAASIGSYAFLNTVPASALSSTEAEVNVDLPQNEERILMPDVKIVKKLLEAAKMLLPVH